VGGREIVGNRENESETNTEEREKYVEYVERRDREREIVGGRGRERVCECERCREKEI
jgi:hypothetical protein